jgi:hypothetical protein
MTRILRSAAFLLAGFALLSGCGGGGGDASTSTGTLALSMTDAPACGYDHVYITVEEVLVHQSADAQEDDAGWQQIPIVDGPKRIDLLELTNGVLEYLGQAVLPAGKYTQMRLVLADNSIWPWPNSVVLSDSKMEEALKTPSAQQSGLKINVDITIEPGMVADFVIDFDACKSVVKAGASGQYLLKPVVSVIPVINEAGQRIVGYLDPLSLGASTLVSVQKDGVVIKSTMPKESVDPAVNGQFVLYPVPPGTYDLVVVSSGRATAVMTGVPVTTTEYTYVGSDTVRIALEGSLTNFATGAVSLNANPVNTGATIRALQKLYNGPTIEVASMQVDADTGEYGFSLPIAAPRVTSYLVINPLSSIGFEPDSTDPALTAAGKYTLEASIAGLATQTADINLLLNGDTVQDFSFTLP